MIRLILSKSSSFWLYYLLAGLVLVPLQAAEPEAAPSEAAMEAHNAYGLAKKGGDYEQALSHAKMFRAAIIEQYGKSHPYFGVGLNNLASCLKSLGRPEEALPLYRENLLITESSLGRSHPNYGTSLSNLAGCLESMNRFDEALPLYREALLNAELTLGESHSKYGTHLSNLGGCLDSLGRFDEALTLHREALLNAELALGELHPKYGMRLYNLAWCLDALGRYEEALPLYREIMLSAELSVGKSHPDYVASLNNYSAYLDFLSYYEEALPLYREALLLAESSVGKSHPDYGVSLDNLAACLGSLGRFEEALPLYREALLNAESAIEKSHPDYGTHLNNLALCLNSLGRSEEALPLLREALLNVETALGKSHSDYGISLHNLALCLNYLGRFEEALPLYEAALLSSESALGKSDPTYGQILHNLAKCLGSLGRSVEALPVYRAALLNIESALGKSHASYGICLNSLGSCLDFLGRSEEALPLLREALLNAESELGKSHPIYGMRLNGLAMGLNSLGRFEEALPLFREALLNAESTLGKSHRDYGAYLNNLASCLDFLRRFEEALPLLREALLNAESTLGKSHPDYGIRLNNLAGCLSALGRFEEALPLYREALVNLEPALGKSHPNYGMYLNNLALCLDSLNRSDEALPLLRESLLNAEPTLGKSHPDYSMRLSNLAGCLGRIGRFEEALPLYREALTIVVSLLERDSIFRSEQEQLFAAERVSGSLDKYLAAEGVTESEGFEQILNWKGAILTRQRAVRLAAEDPEVAPMFAALQANAAQLAALSGNYPDEPAHVSSWKARLDELHEQQEVMERELNAASAVYREGTKRVTLESFQAILPEGAIFLDYFVYHKEGEAHLLVHAVDVDSVSRYELGAFTLIQDAVSAWRADLLSRADDRASGGVIRELIWDQLASSVADREMVLICPDSVLGTIPFAALPDSDGARLLENYRLALVPVPQLLPALLSIDGAKGKSGLMTIGDVDYDRRAESDEPEASEPESSRGLLSSSIRGGASFGSLAQTSIEVASIERLYHETFAATDGAVVSFQGTAANEATFREQAGEHGHLHIATHGFFAPPEVKSALDTSEDDTREGLSRFSNEGRQAISGYDPNLLSGLVFAGANLPVESGDTDDGILTSREIAFLSLEDVGLVALSACETGLGDVAGGEGLLGIQRAFQISGARSTIASLWTVDDLATRELMERFYTNYWGKGMSKLDALREAQLAQMTAASTAGSNRGLDFEDEDAAPARVHPYYWAAFQLSGDWR